MVRCPNCKKELEKPEKTWTYGVFEVHAHYCRNCRIEFREYLRNGKHSFMLELRKGKGYVKI